MIVRTFRIEGNQRYSWIKNQRSLFVCRTPALHLAPQNDQLMSENRILCLKSAPRLEWRGQDGHYEIQQRDHGALTLGDSFG
jgi:hypothetical protein